MKYLFVIVVLFVACNGSEEKNAHYEAADSAIDSVLAKNKELHYIIRSKPADLEQYYKAVFERFAFAEIYQKELNNLERGEQKNKIIKRYNKEVRAEPYKFFPTEEMNDSQRALFIDEYLADFK